MRRRDVGRGRRLRSGFTPNSGLGGLEAGSGARRKRGARPRSARSVLRRGCSFAELGCGTREQPDVTTCGGAERPRRKERPDDPRDAGNAEGPKA
jgi:hypothetical protein